MIHSLYKEINVITLEGRVENENFRKLQHLLEDCISAGSPKICIDMTEVDYISSATMSFLISTKKMMQETQGAVKLVVINETLVEIFRITNLNKFFEIYRSRLECLASFETQQH